MNWTDFVKNSSEAEIAEMLTELFCTAEALKEINEDYKSIIKAFLDGNVSDEVRETAYEIINAESDN